MHVGLIYPRYQYPTRSLLAAPLGILSIAAVLQQKGHAVRFLDLTFKPDLDEVAPFLEGLDAVGLSLPSSLAGQGFRVARLVKSLSPGLPVVAGGPHATLFPGECLDNGFDYVVLGEGEDIAPPLFGALEEGRGVEAVQSIAYRVEGSVRVNPRTSFIEDLDSLPFPARELLEWSRYYGAGGYNSVMTSRGCPYNCYFCKPMQDMLFGRKIRRRSVENVLDEIEGYGQIWEEFLKSRNAFIPVPFHLMFNDDTFIIDRAWALELCRRKKERKMNFVWTCQARVSQVDEELLAAMKDAGCQLVGFGVESGSQKVLDYLRKGIRIEDTKKAFAMCHRVGIQSHAFIIIGSPVETRDDLEETLRLVREIRPTTVMVSRLTPVQGSGLYDDAKRDCLIAGERLDEESDYLVAKYPLKLPHLTQADLDEYEEKIREPI